MNTFINIIKLQVSLKKCFNVHASIMFLHTGKLEISFIGMALSLSLSHTHTHTHTSVHTYLLWYSVLTCFSYVFVFHVLQHSQFSVRSLGVDSSLKWSGQLLNGHLHVHLCVQCRTGITVGKQQMQTLYTFETHTHIYIHTNKNTKTYIYANTSTRICTIISAYIVIYKYGSYILPI